MSKKNRKPGRSHSFLRPTTWLLLLMAAAAVCCALLYMDLFRQPIAAASMAQQEDEDGEDEEQEEDAEEPATTSSDEVSDEEIAAVRQVLTGLRDEVETAIVDGSSALDALEEVAGSLGISDVSREYKFDQETSTASYNYYRLQQYYDGIEVYGYFLKIIADKDGNFSRITGEYAEIGELDTSYPTSATDAKNAVIQYLAEYLGLEESDISSESPQKIIYVPEGDAARIAWLVTGTPEGYEDVRLVLDAMTCEVIAVLNEFMTSSVTLQALGQQNEYRDIVVEEKSDYVWLLADEERQIYIFDNDTFQNITQMTVSKLKNDAMEYVAAEAITAASRTAVDALYNMEQAYDFYLDCLGRQGVTNSEDAREAVVIDYVYYNDDGSQEYNNAAFAEIDEDIDTAYFVVMPALKEKVTSAYYLDVMAHEFTHGVVRWESALGTNLPSGTDDQKTFEAAINEGLADVMGEFAEDYADDGELNNTCDWDHGATRTIYSHYNKSNGEDLITLLDYFKEGETDGHYGSAIISYPAYLMNAGLEDHELIPTSVLSQLYYDTLCSMASDMSFWSFRSFLEFCAIDMNIAGSLTDAQLETVIDALDYSGVEPLLASYKVETGGRLTILDQDGEEYADYSIRIEKGLGGEVVVDEQDVGNAVYTLPESLVPGYYWVTLTDVNNTELSEEFYILVNDNDSFSAGRIDEYESSQDVLTQFGSALREVVLVLDVSGSMGGDPITSTKSAALEFVETVMTQSAGLHISVITYSDDASVKISSSAEQSKVRSAVSSISANGGTNMYEGLSQARSILKQSSAVQKCIVLMSDGLPNHGESDSGDYGAPVKRLASSLKSDDVTIYALGFFSELSGSDLTGAISLMRSIATSGYYYNISEDGIGDVFEDMASLVNGNLYYNITLACPVEVAVTSGTETLSSSARYGGTRTSFGSVTYEGEDEDDRTKIVRLLTDRDYEICVYGTGSGTMDYIISFPDEEGDYTDVRTFSDVSITKSTKIVSTTVQEEETVLQIDSDGDGSFDTVAYAPANGEGRERADLMETIRPYIGIALIALLILAVVIEIIMILRRLHKPYYCGGCGSRITYKMQGKFCGECGAKITLPNPLLPYPKDRRKSPKPVRIVKIVLAALCIAVIAGSAAIERSAAHSVYDQIREHQLVSAKWMYEGTTKDSALSRLLLEVMLDHYVDQVQDAQEDGEVSSTYAAEVYELVEGMDLDRVSEQASRYLEDLSVNT